MIAAMPDTRVRCERCGKLLAEVVSRPWRIVCPRCKQPNSKVA